MRISSERVSIVVADAGALIALGRLRPLDPGESSAIARAREIGAGLLMDDRAAVAHARAIGLKVLGTLGILVLAKRRGLLKEIRPLVHQMRDGGHYLSEAAIRAALDAAGEI